MAIATLASPFRPCVGVRARRRDRPLQHTFRDAGPISANAECIVGPVWAKTGLNWARTTHIGTFSAKFRSLAMLDHFRGDVDRVWPDARQLWGAVDILCSVSTEFGSHSVKSRRLRRIQHAIQSSGPRWRLDDLLSKRWRNSPAAASEVCVFRLGPLAQRSGAARAPLGTLCSASRNDRCVRGRVRDLGR